MVDPAIESRIQKEIGVETLRADPSETDDNIIALSEDKEAPVLTRDWDFEEKHRRDKNHYGILFDPRMHHRNPDTVINSIKSVLDNMNSTDLKGTVVRLKRFY